MTLLETLVAIALLSVIITVVFGLFKQVSLLGRATDAIQKESFEKRHLQTRLQFIFERIVNENETGRPFYFYSEPANPSFSDSPSLIFTFDSGVRKDPHFSGDVLARLYVDLKHRLRLSIWPLQKDKPLEERHDEILMKDVKELTYAFYAPPAKNDSPHQTGENVEIDLQNGEQKKEKTPTPDEWHTEWEFDYRQMPSLLKITLEEGSQSKNFLESKEKNSQEQKKFELSFVLPSSKHPVHY